jgi:hypothetical protein
MAFMYILAHLHILRRKRRGIQPEERLKVIDTVSNHIGKKGIYAVDRGKLYNKFLEKKKEKRFVIRLTKTLDLVHKGVKKKLS